LQKTKNKIRQVLWEFRLNMPFDIKGNLEDWIEIKKYFILQKKIKKNANKFWKEMNEEIIKKYIEIKKKINDK
jgi:hypothetical protein